ncbi:MBL fold metallo-hydrolase [Paenibacillus sp. MMS20-IR301]|uniref:MBL fold metallo-hydrolase n=1 Tax=Paenibacillus sp. MMS20-IR301 TaxID=2895946 RepID=UPI0028E869D3|nr:MBL fold metallo-hydrolase [Paenibacillus sp. MMS20-IR301]WNS41088.1 MBL fold metallo-hydrolase [Paenibacillus sp. MMS20-IR301]
MKIQLIRHAALWLEYGGSTFLIDPMLSAQGVNPPIMNSGDDRRNPLTPLPGPVQQWLDPDAVIVTHLHQDHWDAAAAELLNPKLPLLCQEGDGEKITAQGFGQVKEIDDNVPSVFRGVTLSRTGGRHGTGEIGARMGKVSGCLFQAEGEPVVYLAGDTIWCKEVEDVLTVHQPDIIIVNAGGASFTNGGHITMNEQDIVELCHAAPTASVIAVHMDTINHCRVTRGLLKLRLEQEGLLDRVAVPLDGEWV